jgi:hypothetical protein
MSWSHWLTFVNSKLSLSASCGVKIFHKLPICSLYIQENEGQMRGHFSIDRYPTQSIGGVKITVGKELI